ncbi:MAG: DnaJ C-terminal domain-containing protein [Terriglobales bacterium]
MVKFKDYYDTLGVNRSATDKEIKAAYRKLARQNHPDANKGNKQSEEKFKEIAEAYEVLKDPEKRRRYDALGANYKAGSEFRPPPDFGGFSFDFGDLGKGGAAFSDFFEALFGQSFGPGAGGPQGGFRTAGAGAAAGRRRAAPEQEADIELSIEELAKGTTRTLQISGGGMKPRTLEVKIPAGVRAGSRVRVAGGEQKGSAAGPGDLYLRVKVKAHPYFTMDGDNLVTELSISPAQAVLGGEATVNTLDGPVRIRVPAATQNGRMLRLREKGLPKLKTGVRGDQLVRVKINIPSTISDEERKLYEQLSQLEKSHGS